MNNYEENISRSREHEFRILHDSHSHSTMSINFTVLAKHKDTAKTQNCINILRSWAVSSVQPLPGLSYHEKYPNSANRTKVAKIRVT